ncbi:MAG: methyltransferase domain-containing protein [Parcubacteria group bacterium]|nr:methyltransferase domain-containing protein [Parcubacteria group bacterium]
MTAGRRATTAPACCRLTPWQGEGRGEVILDPFCGSGTILTEAALMGYKNLIGSDISDKALQATKTNIAWLQSNFQLSTFNFQLFHSDATQISKQIAPNSIDAIITEPYLGPQRGRIEINKIKLELEKLYSESLREFSKILKPSGRIVMIWPVFQMSSGAISFPSFPRRRESRNSFSENTLHPNLDGFKIINPIPANLRKNIWLKLTERNTIIYGREGQKIWREIVVLKKQIKK